MLSTIRNFALSFFITLVIFGIAAYFLVGFIEKNMTNVLNPGDGSSPDSVSGSLDPENTEDVPEESDGGSNRLTFLICGLDNGLSQRNGSLETDLIILLQIDKVKREFMFTALSCDTKVDYKGYTLRLGMVHKLYDIYGLVECVKAHTGLGIDFYAMVNYTALQKVFDITGDIDYNVSMDMYYMPAAADVPEINLQKGMQKLNYEKALQLLRYKDYSNGDLGRVATAVDFCKEILRQKVTFENYSKAPLIFKALKESITTNMTEDALTTNLDLLFSYSKYTVKEIVYPGKLDYLNGNMFFFPNVPKGITEFKDYRQSDLVR